MAFFKSRRRCHNLTKKALADKTYVSRDYVSHVEDGRRLPSLKFCLQCAEIFGANPEWVKRKWAREMVIGFEERLRIRLNIEN